MRVFPVHKEGRIQRGRAVRKYASTQVRKYANYGSVILFVKYPMQDFIYFILHSYYYSIFADNVKLVCKISPLSITIKNFANSAPFAVLYLINRRDRKDFCKGVQPKAIYPLSTGL